MRISDWSSDVCSSDLGSAIVDLTSVRDDPLSSGDGWEPIRHRLGITYEDDCLSIALTWRRNYIDIGDARLGNSFSFRVAFRHLGLWAARARPRSASVQRHGALPTANGRGCRNERDPLAYPLIRSVHRFRD